MLFIEMSQGDGPGSIIQRILIADAYCFTHNKKFGGVLSDQRKNESYWHHPVFYEELNKFFSLDIKGINSKKDNKSDEFHHTDKILEMVEKDIDTYFNDKWREKVTKNISGFSKNIAVHVRRGDVDKKVHPGRYLDDHVYIELIDKVLKENRESVTITLHSQKPFNGNIGLYIKKYRKNHKLKILLDNTPKSDNKEGLRLLIKNIFRDWKIMITSHIFIGSRSSFSYVPALLNKNRVYFPRFWHPQLKDWVPYLDS